MPGLETKDVEVKVANGVLTVKGERQQEKEEKREDSHLRERRFNSFERSIRVPLLGPTAPARVAFAAAGPARARGGLAPHAQSRALRRAATARYFGFCETPSVLRAIDQ